MARKRKPAPPDLDRPGQPPLLRGHLRPGGVRSGETDTPTGAPEGAEKAQPAEQVAAAAKEAPAVRGRATKSSEDVATRPHLEGAEQGPA